MRIPKGNRIEIVITILLYILEENARMPCPLGSARQLIVMQIYVRRFGMISTMMMVIQTISLNVYYDLCAIHL